MITRTDLHSRIRRALRRSRVVLLSGPRQCGKTTLARTLLDSASPNYFDLERPTDLARLAEPYTALEPLRGLVVIDEIQRVPELFPVLRVLADRQPLPARFLILGSATGDLMRQGSESLAGRVERIAIGGFTLAEVGADAAHRLWRRGAFPLAFTARTEANAAVWREDFIQLFLERDLPLWGVRVPVTALRRFWRMLAHYHGQIWNAAAPARALDVHPTTTRRYLDVLTDAMMVRQLQPWFANVGKRQVKAPKVYLRDSGLLHQLLGLTTEKAVLSHPQVGASWEGMVIEQALASEPHDEACYWATYQGAEMDLLLRRGDRLYGVECRRTDAPRMTKSIGIALNDLGLQHVAVLYPGDKRYPIADRVEAVPFATLATPGQLFKGV